MKTFGLDLGTSLIKAVSLGKEKKEIILEKVGSISTPPKGLVSESPLDEEAIAEAIKRLLSEVKISTRNVNTALPDAKVFTRVIKLPLLSEKEVKQALQWEAEQYIPFPLEEVNLDFSILEKDKKLKKMRVLLIAAPIRLIEKYTRILEMAGLFPLAIETEIISVSRAISTQGPQQEKAVMVINLGSSATSFSILTKGRFSFAGSISTGGQALARAIASELDFDISQAEEYKKTYGLEENKLGGKILNAVRPIVDEMLEEIKKALSYYHRHGQSESVSSLILTGGTARLPGIASYLTQNLGIESQIGNPWLDLKVDASKTADYFNDSVLFAAATGLALREYFK